MRRFRSPCAIVWSVVALSLLLVACGSSSSVQLGYFKDSPVAGISYSTPTQSGLTDASGTFTYRQGELVTFSLGGVTLGTARGAQLVTPIDLVPGATDQSDPTVTNICRLLQSLDQDGNPDNGIVIPARVRSEMEQMALDFRSPGFGNSPTLCDLFRRLNSAAVFPRKRALVDPATAQAHFGRLLTGDPPSVPLGIRTVQKITDAPAHNIHEGGMALAYDSQDVPHVIVGGDHLYHYTRASSGWSAERIDVEGVSTAYLSRARLFVDAADYLHLVFTDTGNALKYLTNRSGSWTAETINADAAVVDRNGCLHVISYRASNHTFSYGTSASGPWTNQTFSAEPAGGSWANLPPTFPVLLVDGTGKVHLAYSKYDSQGVGSANLYYASNATGAWRVELLSQGASVAPSSIDLVVDAAGAPHLAYGYYGISSGTQVCSGACDNPGQVSYFTKVNGQWVQSTPDGSDLPDSTRVSVSKQGAVYLMTDNTGSLSFVAKDGATWSRRTVPGPLASVTAFASGLDGSDTFHLAHLYQNELHYATLQGGQWVTEGISLVKATGEYPDLALDSGGFSHVSYWDAERQALMYATNSQGAWTTESVKENATIGKATSIAVDYLGRVHICYLDTVTGSVMYARKTAGAWSVQAIAGNAYGRPVLKVDGSGTVHIVYLDWVRWYLVYAQNSSGAWACSDVVPVDWRGARPDLSVTPSGKAFVSIEVWGLSSSPLSEGIWLLTRDAGSATWNFDKAYPRSIYNSYCRLIADESGGVHLAYRIPGLSGSLDQLIYSWRDNGAWQALVVATGDKWQFAIALDPGGTPYLSYYDANNSVLKYSYLVGPAWLTKELARLNNFDHPDFLAPIVFDAAGGLHTAYFDYGNADLTALTIAQPTANF